jgi:peptide deformylase
MKKTSKRQAQKVRVKKTKLAKKKIAPLTVFELGQKILRAKTKRVQFPQSPKIKKLVMGMIATCQKEGGVGIAAPQVGSLDRVFIMWERPTKTRPDLAVFGPEAVINPVYVSKSEQMKSGYEGCLSIPGIYGKVLRHKKIEVVYTNGEGKKIRCTFSNFLARVFQHEYDHLDGIVYLDRIQGKDIITKKEYIKMCNIGIVHKKTKKK